MNTNLCLLKLSNICTKPSNGMIIMFYNINYYTFLSSDQLMMNKCVKYFILFWFAFGNIQAQEGDSENVLFRLNTY